MYGDKAYSNYKKMLDFLEKGTNIHANTAETNTVANTESNINTKSHSNNDAMNT